MNINQLSVALYTIIYKEVRRFMRIWPQTLLPPAITMSLYFVIFGNLVGSRIGEMGGYSYMEFIVPGLIMMAVITNSYANVSSSFFSSKFQKSIEELIRSEVRRFMRIWPQTLLPPAITMSLYFVIFGNLVGSRIGEMGGYSYMEFIVPGLIMMAVITNSYANVSSSFFSSKFQKSIEELIMSPVPMHAILWGHVLGGVIRGILVAIIVSAVSLFFADLYIT